MPDKNWIDPFSDGIIKRIDPKVRDSLTPTQLTAIKEAIRGPRAPIKPIDIRGVIPLYFARYFFVLLIGRDRRAAVIREEGFRRIRSRWLNGLFFSFFVACPLVVIVFLFLYLLKTIWGLDIMPDQHLWDIFK